MPTSTAPCREPFEEAEPTTGVRMSPVANEDIAPFLPLVRRMAAKMARKLPRSVLMDDLVAAGAFGLMDALRRFDGERGAEFEWYARVRVRGAMVDELRNNDWLSRHFRSEARAHVGDVDREKVVVVGFEDVPEKARTPATRESTSPAELVEKRMDREALGAAIRLLPEREGRIVAMHYFEGCAFKDIAARLSVSEPRVSQLHARAVKLLQEILAPVSKDCA